jgi:hypothetical protein
VVVATLACDWGKNKFPGRLVAIRGCDGWWSLEAEVGFRALLKQNKLGRTDLSHADHGRTDYLEGAGAQIFGGPSWWINFRHEKRSCSFSGGRGGFSGAGEWWE